MAVENPALTAGRQSASGAMAHVAEAVNRCPFLTSISLPTDLGGIVGRRASTLHSSSSTSTGVPAAVGAQQKPTARGGGGGALFSDLDTFDSAFRVFHGADGVVPLTHKCPHLASGNASIQLQSKRGSSEIAAREGACPHLAAPRRCPITGRTVHDAQAVVKSAELEEESRMSLSSSVDMPLGAARAVPAFATISMSAFGASRGMSRWGDRSAEGIESSADNSKPQHPHERPSGKSFSMSAEDSVVAVKKGAEMVALKSKKPTVQYDDALESFMQSNCPIAKATRFAQSVAPWAFRQSLVKGKPDFSLKCPEAIVVLRAKFAQLPPVRTLRPKPLPVKILGVGAVSLAVNVPLGAVREHCVKFSPAWFVAVHASIPLIALLRKSVVLPPYAIAFTIMSAIIGQTIGSRAERRRMQQLIMAAEAAEGDQTQNLHLGSCRKEGVQVDSIISDRPAAKQPVIECGASGKNEGCLVRVSC